MRPPRLPAALAVVTLILSLTVAVSGGLGLAMALKTPGRALFIGFEATLILAGIFGALTALHRFKTGPALAIACVGASVFACGILSEPQLVPKLMGQQVVPPVVWGINLIKLALARAIIGVALIAIAGVAVLLRRPRESFRHLLLAASLGAPILVVAALTRVPAVMNATKALPPAVIAVLVCVLFLVLGVCFSICVHCAIRSFEVAREADRPESPAA
jgi:hypothetical protein